MIESQSAQAAFTRRKKRKTYSENRKSGIKSLLYSYAVKRFFLNCIYLPRFRLQDILHIAVTLLQVTSPLFSRPACLRSQNRFCFQLLHLHKIVYSYSLQNIPLIYLQFNPGLCLFLLNKLSPTCFVSFYESGIETKPTMAELAGLSVPCEILLYSTSEFFSDAHNNTKSFPDNMTKRML